jgi:hypothetical protein
MTAPVLSAAPAQLQPVRDRRSGIGTAIFFATLAAISALTAYIGLARLRAYEHDIFFLLDNAWRVTQGQVPHRDFSSAWGPVIYLVDAVGLLLSGMRPDGVAYANALFAGVIGAWAYWIGRARLGSMAAYAMGVYTALLIAAPFAMGFSPLIFTHAMVYNRYGYALLGIILVECASHALGRDDDAGEMGAVSSGAAFAVLGFLKISYGLMAVPFLLLGYGSGARRGRRLLVFCGAAAAVSAMFLLYLRFDLRDMIGDLLIAANGRSKSWKPGEIPGLSFGQWGESIPLLALAATVAVAGRGAGKLPWREMLLAAVTLTVGGILVSTNQQHETLPLNAYAALVLAAPYLRRNIEAGPPARAAVFLAAMCVLPVAAANVKSLAAAAIERGRPDRSEAHLTAERGAGIVFGPVAQAGTTETGGAAYVRSLNDGLELLWRRTGPGDGVLAIVMFNPFNYLLERRSPRGGISAAAYNYVFSDAAHPDADRFFGDARWVMVRKYGRDADDFPGENAHVQGLYRIYRAELERRYRVVEETGHWVLYGSR